MNIQEQLQKEQRRVRQEFDTLLTSLTLEKKLSSEFIIDLVYYAGERWGGEQAHLHFQKELSKKMSHMKSQEKLLSVLELAFQFWNYFPHKDMDDKTPFELSSQHVPNSNNQKTEETTVVVGSHKMTMGQYEKMLSDMEKTQKPFHDWLKQEVMPAYEQYLLEKYKGRTIQKHAAIADILCDRLLMSGFISPEHVRHEFLFLEFPLWWQTHVMFGNYNETAVENSIVTFLDFIEDTYDVVMDAEYIESDIDMWQ